MDLFPKYPLFTAATHFQKCTGLSFSHFTIAMMHKLVKNVPKTHKYLDLLDLWLFEGWDRFDLLLFEANKYQNCPKYPKSTN